MAGQIQMMFIGVHSSLPLMKIGKIRGLGVTSTKRSDLAPELPTLSEAGLRGFHVNTWYGILGPAGMPRNIVDKLNAALKTSLKDPAVRERLTAQGFDIVPGTPEEFGSALKEEIDTWAKVVKQAGAKAD
jgi:tripartite-type tricarboxylate transporter receptor subunit TctC